MVVESQIGRAKTLPASFYVDADRHAQVIERIFVPAWHYVGTAQEVSTPGQVVPRILGAGSLDEPVLLVRDEQGVLRVLSNVCTHRAMLLVDQPCMARNLRCGYHGRRFSLQGRLKAAPGFEGAQDFPGPNDDLPELQVGQWGPLVFASLQPEVPFETWIQPVRERLAFFEPARMRAAPERDRTYEVKASWLAYCDNYLEGLHIPYVHPGLTGALDVAAYRGELLAQGSLQIGVGQGTGGTFELPAGHPEAGQSIAGYYFALFPHTLFNLYPWGLSLNVVEPDGPTRCRVRFLSFVAEASRLREGAGADLHQVEMEDERVVEAVAQGLRSRLYRGGRYAPQHEAGVHHFHRLLSERLGGPEAVKVPT